MTILSDFDIADLADQAERATAHLQKLAAAQEQAALHLIDAALNAAEAVGSAKFAGRANVSHAARMLVADLTATRTRYARALEVVK